jgi:FKBP-type peptidyl-prolyl cis-trans isomerase FklB
MESELYQASFIFFSHFCTPGRRVRFKIYPTIYVTFEKNHEMRQMQLVIVSILSVMQVMAQNNPLTTEKDSISYGLGIIMGTSIGNAGIEDLNDELFLKGINDAIDGNQPVLAPDQANKFLNEYVGKLNAKRAQKNLEESKEFLAENSKKEGVVTLPSGLQYKVVRDGIGKSPADTSFVTVHYTGRLLDGKIFDSSVERGQPAQFPVNGVIPGWTEALKLMKTGASWILYIPPELGYGERGTRGIMPNSVLVFEVELLGVD